MLVIIISIVAVVISLLNYLLSRSNRIANDEKIAKFESNCITTLKADVKEIKKDLGNQRDDIAKIFDKVEKLTDRVGHVEGRLNGR
jgi:uncharacterized protein YdcH (DUF465 family)